MNVFSSTRFLASVARAAFPRRSWEPAEVTVAGRAYRVLRVGGRLIGSWPFLDFYEPAERGASAGRASYLPSAATERMPVARWQPGSHLQPAPSIDWSGFDSFGAFEALVKSRVGNLFPDTRRKRRRLERDVGPVRFVFDDPSPAAFAACLRWKSAQYRASGYVDQFADRRNVLLFELLREQGLCKTSALYAGDRLAAVHLGALWDRRFYWWVPAYDPALGPYSPGRLMLHTLIEESRKRGDTEFDFLIGDESYKWHYATHTRAVSEVGEVPLPVRAARLARRTLRPRLQRLPWLWERTRSLRQRFR